MDTRKKRVRLALISLGLFALILIPRLIGIGKFMSLDEPAWLLYAANYYLALTKGKFEQTLYEYHPAVTTLWVLTAGFLSYFPGYRLVAKFTDKYWNVDGLFQQYHKSPLTLMVHARIIAVLGIAVMLVASFGLLDILVGGLAALMVVLMIAFDPFFLGNSRLLNHEGLMATFILVSILAALVFLEKRPQKRYLALSGAAAGLALLTKSTAILLLPLTGLMFLVSYLQRAGKSTQKGRLAARYAGLLCLWFGILGLVYFVVWPGMWVAPGEMLYAVYGNAFSYAFQGARLSVTQELAPQTFSLDFGGIGAYLGVVFLKSTPVAWLGFILALIGMWVKQGHPMSSLARKIVIYFGLLGLGFLVLFGVAHGRNHNHYVLTSFVALDVIAGIGLAWGLGWLAARFPNLKNRQAQAALVTGIILVHGVVGLPQYPYYFTYTNPLAQSLVPGLSDPDLGYGEGLELAGEYLAQKPDAQNMKVMSWYAAGCFSYFFPGTSYNLISLDVVYNEYVERMRASNYLVIYTIVQQPSNMPVKLMQALKAYPPEHVIWINGHEYVQIYNVKDFPDAFFDAIAN